MHPTPALAWGKLLGSVPVVIPAPNPKACSPGATFGLTGGGRTGLLAHKGSFRIGVRPCVEEVDCSWRRGQ
ncbi:hypothetical protein LZ31DRAFT_39487 [Colletotrichum somersetense]|nr:hypothetical protein LZ31DRAFT_39487 [Colletotrichum somersetense]